jgi:hypothetical protein
MKNTVLSLGFAALALVAISIPAHATSADFEGYCTPISHICDYNSGLTSSGGSGTSCSPGTITSYSWSDSNGGSGSGSTYTTNWGAGSGGGTVTLTVHCSGGTNPTITRSVCFGFGGGTCIVPNTCAYN